MRPTDSIQQLGSTEQFQIFMEHSSNGDPRGDIIARGIVSEEQARMMYERYVTPIWKDLKIK